MRIEEVITEAVLAVYTDTDLSEHMYLKGGAALRLLDDLTTRLSMDADFSLDHPLENPEEFFETIHQSLIRRFEPHEFDILDFKHRRKPEKAHPDKPDWWGCWVCEFKLCPHSFQEEPLEIRRRNALVPKGIKKSTISLDISDHEYCGTGRRKVIAGVEIHGYTRELLVLEKLRAICQQHPDYPYSKDKNRARDFYDILQLTQDTDEAFLATCRNEIDKVFDAKEVPHNRKSELVVKRRVTGRKVLPESGGPPGGGPPPDGFARRRGPRVVQGESAAPPASGRAA